MHLPIITISIILFTAATSIAAFPIHVPTIESLRNEKIYYRFLFNAYSVWHDKQIDRTLTYGFLHGNWWHLIFNMITFYFFGKNVELIFSMMLPHNYYKIIFLLYYLTAIIVSTLPDLIQYRNKPEYNAVGASGAVSAIVFTHILFLPTAPIYFFFIPFGIPSWIFAILYLIYSAFMARKKIDNIGHSAHFWGAIYGIIVPLLLFGFNLFTNFIDEIMYGASLN